MRTLIIAMVTIFSTVAMADDKSCSGANACKAKIEQQMSQKISNPKEWYNNWTENDEGRSWKLFQLSVDSARFAYVSDAGSKPYVIAILKSSIKQPMTQGQSLTSLVDCLKSHGSVKQKNAQGFAMEVKLYEAVSCK